MAQLLKDSILTAEQRLHLEYLISSSCDLRFHMDELLDLEKIEAGRLTLEAHDFDLRDALESIFNLYIPIAQAKQLKLDLKVINDVPLLVCGDSTRLRQILSNLISNAIKFSSMGTIYISAEIALTEQGDYRLQCSVRDSGIGISQNGLDRLFKPYSQACNSTTRQYGGTGLGLSICALLCKAMGGSITAESHFGSGATFRFDIRLQVSDNKPVLFEGLTNQKYQIDRNLRILLVDDNQINCILVNTLLIRLGIKADLANNGSEAVSILQSGAVYDIVLMDLEMPVMGGIEATMSIRQLALPVQPFIIAITANAYATDHQRCIDAGMNDFLRKPFTLVELQAKLVGPAKLISSQLSALI
jgi:CheY-like chemotaxis protein